ncbi:MAG: hypothetical protein ACOZNI_15590, partial [Myxococcota bacterium]
LPAVAVVAAALARFPEWVVAVLAVPATLWFPGRGFARLLGDDPLARAIDAVWISAVLAVPAVVLAAWTGGSGWTVLAVATAFAVAGAALPAHLARPLDARARVGAVAVMLAVAAVAVDWRGAIARPLERHWWHRVADEGFAGEVDPGFGWLERARIGGAWRLVPKNPEPYLIGPVTGTVMLVLRGPVGATLTAGDAVARVEADVVEDPAEGPVPRYLARGAVALPFTSAAVAGEQIPLRLSHPDESVLYVVPDTDALWELHGRGELRFVHYYQLLNMVEQVRWANELFGERRVTDVQPPLWSYVAAAPLGLTGGDLPTQSVLFLLLLVPVGLAGVACVRAWAPAAPLGAWLLPAGACAEHAKLLLEPGSVGMPDTLYTFAILGVVGGVAAHDRRYGAQALLAQLSRYPGALVAAIAGLLAGEPARVGRMLAGVLLVAALFGVGGLLSGSLDGWLATVWWETGPEHWHGETDPAVLLGRAPGFWATWIGYAGFLPVLAAARWPKGTRIALGTALLYSCLLATIDHRPSHYFLPLVHLSAVAGACTAAAGGPILRVGVPLLGLLGLWGAYTSVPVTG